MVPGSSTMWTSQPPPVIIRPALQHTQAAPRRRLPPRVSLSALLSLLAVLLSWVSARPAAASPPGAEPAPVLQSAFCDGVTEIPQTECEALTAFYQSTGGPQWARSEGWLQTSTPCDWYGVSCGGGHVTAIQLFDNHLTGNLPPQLGNLSHLTYLGLGSNALGGELPSELGDLSQLTMLILYNNQLTGPIPPALGRLNQLTHLRLYTNQLSGEPPSQLGDLSSLTELVLKSNQLSGEIPPELAQLGGLRILYLGCNQLSGEVPPELIGLDSLSRYGLDLGHNMLTASDDRVNAFLTARDADWAESQTVAPPDVHVVSASSDSVELAWTPTGWQDGGYYEISHSVTQEGPYSVLHTTADKTIGYYRAYSLSPCSGSYFRIRTYTPAHGHPGQYLYQQSDLWSGYAEVAVWPLPAPSLTHSQAHAGLPLTLRWERLGGAISYDLQVADESGFASPRVSATISVPSYTAAAPLGEGTYYWRVRGTGPCGNGPWAAPQPFTVLPGEPIFLPIIPGR